MFFEAFNQFESGFDLSCEERCSTSMVFFEYAESIEKYLDGRVLFRPGRQEAHGRFVIKVMEGYLKEIYLAHLFQTIRSPFLTQIFLCRFT